MTKYFLFLFIGVLSFSCNVESYKYPNDPKISNISGQPYDSLTFYFPFVIKSDNKTTKIEIDSFEQNWYSSVLYSAKEPILYNSYQGHDIYRFLWLRSFHRPVIFSLNKVGNKVWLTTKILNKQPNFIEMKVFSESVSEVDTIENEDRKFERLIPADRKAEIVLNQTKQLTKKEWSEFENLLKECSFWTTKPYQMREGLDGSEWILEGHKQNKYWFVDRWSPKGNFRKAGEYLIEESGLDEKKY